MILSICIPTYNREKKVLRILESYYDQILRSDDRDQIEILVSNNASVDNTKQVLDELDYAKINFKVFHQTENIGFDLNCKFLYKEAKARYVWYMGDDDLIFENTVQTVFDHIKSSNYGAMRFSFMQPIGNAALDFDLPGGIAHPITNTPDIILYCFAPTKLSTYVLKRVEPVEELFSPITQFEGQGFWFIALAVRIFEKLAGGNDGLLIYNKQLASCDDEVFATLDVPPEVWNNRTNIANYPFVKVHRPKLAIKLFKDDYRFTISFLWKYKSGEYVIRNEEAYERFIKEIKIHLRYLIGKRGLLYKLLILKLKLYASHAAIFNSKK